MLDRIDTALLTLWSASEPLGWAVLAAFLAGVGLEYADREEQARSVLVFAWVLFGAFWLTLVYPWFVADESVVRGVGAVVAAPLSFLVAKILYEDRRSLFTLSRAVAFMGLLYAPLVVIPPVREQLILLVTNHTAFAMDLLGYDPPVVTEMTEVGIDREIAGKEESFENTFVFWPLADSDVTITYTIIIACTGIGSMAVMGGLIAAVTAPIRRKLAALAVALPIIYVLNIVRNVFIGLSYGHQYADFVPDLTMTLFGLDNPLRVSYIWADRIIAQSMSVVAMVLILWLVIRILPEVMEPVEDVLFLLTGEEYDLAAALNVDTPDSRPETAD